MIQLAKGKSFTDFFPVPEFMLLSTTGVVITDDDTKFVQLGRSILGDDFELIHASKSPNQKGAVESGLIVRAQELLPVIKKMASHFGARYIRAALPEERSYLFTTTIDWVPEEDLRDAVAFIIEENAPVALSESMFDFTVIGSDEKAGWIKLAVSVVPKDIVKSYENFLASAGLTPISFELESQAIARAVIKREDRRSRLIINISVKKTGFYVVEDGVVQFSTTPVFGIGADGSHSSLGDLRSEMRKVTTFWNLHADKLGHSGRQIEEVTLCGPGASNKTFVEKLMSESNLAYQLADVWINVSSSRGKSPTIPFEQSLDYATAVGLVLSHN